MSRLLKRSLALVCTLLLLTAMGTPARAELPGLPGFPPQPCPPNTSCAPGTPTPPTPPGTCGPGNGGATCGGGGPASTGSGTGINLGAGNPINVINGNKYQREMDMAPLPGTLGLEIVRHYNSAFSGPNASTNLVGRGWKLSYETELYASGRTVQIVQADGARIIFSRDPRDPSLCASNNPANGTVSVSKTASGEEYTWRWTNGRTLNFDNKGKLVQILAPGGQFVSLRYSPSGLLTRVTDPQGRSLELIYPSKAQASTGGAFRGVQSIDSPVGRFTYLYGSRIPAGATVDKRLLLANLVMVTMPSGARTYHYEQADRPTLLTGISELATGSDGKPAWQRIGSYAYGEDGKANLSVRGWPARLARGKDGNPLQPARLEEGTGIGQVTLEYGAGQTTVTNSLGQKTLYRHTILGGEYRLLEVRGAGCATCGETNVRYGYDAEGRLTMTTRTDTRGAALSAESTQYDKQGRPQLVMNHSFANGKPLPGKWKMRFEYAGDSIAPARIIRPSVVPGKEYVTEIAYVEAGEARGSPASVSERGYIPPVSSKYAPLQIVRSIGYRYDGYGQRIETDGPLPNAAQGADPSNSDITRTVYDARTKMVKRTIAPGKVVTDVLERDAALRPTVVRITQGSSAHVVRTRYNWRGQPEQVQVEATVAGGPTLTRTLAYGYDMGGRLVSLTQPGGMTSRFHYDASGQIAERIGADGSRVAVRHDSEGRVRESSLYGADERIAGTARYDYDVAGRIERVRDALGSLGNVAYTDAGQVAEISNALGTTTRFSYDGDGMLKARIEAAGTPDAATSRLAYDAHGGPSVITAPNGVVTRQLFDDFGRKVMDASTDRGMTLYGYDQAGALVARLDHTGVTTRYRYDNAGRLIAIGADEQPNLVQYRYDGMRLAEMVSTTDGKPEHAVERITYRYDAFGRVVHEARWIARVDRAPAAGRIEGLEFITESSYDDAGRLARQRLPDGHEVAYDYAAKSGTLSSVRFDKTVIASHIVRDASGQVRSYLNGNGVHQTIATDARGRITRLTAAATGALPATGWRARVAAWFTKEDAPAAPVYTQENRFDAAGRVVAITRQTGGMHSRAEQFEYDRLNRLTAISAEGEGRTALAYDAGGNRVSQSVTPAIAGALRQAKDEGSAAPVAAELRYHYEPGTNRLSAMGSVLDAATALWAYHPTGATLAQLGSAGARRIVYNQAKRPVAVYGADGQLQARYFYNTLGERSAKTVYPAAPRAGLVRTAYTPAAASTSYSLYRDQRLAAETDAEGRITSHYLYLQGKPLAKIEVAPGGGGMAWWRDLRDLVGLGDSATRVYAIHTDHLGTPQVVTDAARRAVWQAETTPFGQARVLHAATDGNRAPFEMNLRLPGQVFDAETGLHQNYYRDYDPQLGRYTTVDPIGLEGGMNPYTYVSNNPLGNTDPLGLYEIDTHYYTMYVLARAAGLPADQALMVALASQYVDDNPFTTPINFGSITTQTDRLSKYHFTQSGYDRPQNANENSYVYSFERVMNPDNPQLRKLYNASHGAGMSTCTRLQLFGEYLHTFADTFGHRNSINQPIDVNGGVGHALYGHEPDKTYNDAVFSGAFPMAYGTWDHREDRTLKMQEAVFKKIQAEFHTSAKDKYGHTVTFETIKNRLKEFNAIHESEENTSALFNNPGNRKRTELNSLMADLNMGPVPDYNVFQACTNRQKALPDSGISSANYPGTIFATLDVCPTER